jgi:hypothetical protein
VLEVLGGKIEIIEITGLIIGLKNWKIIEMLKSTNSRIKEHW